MKYQSTTQGWFK